MNSPSRLAELFYDFIDANANMKRAEWIARQVDNGVHSAVNLVVMVIVLLTSILLAWYFDFHSTTTAMSGVIALMLPSLPGSWTAAPTVVSGIILLITVTPSLTENFLTNLARADILVVKMFVFGFSIFDMITDIPTTKNTLTLLQSSFDALGPVLGFLVYWIAFFVLLLMATVGFQVSVAIFAYTVLIYARKTFSNAKTPFNSGPAHFNYNMPGKNANKGKVQTVETIKGTEQAREPIRVVNE